MEDAPLLRVPLSMSDAPEVLVTGAAGFIGAAVCRRLVALGARVVGVDDLSAGDPARVADLAGSSFDLVVADVRDESLLDGLLAREPRAVLHLAGHVGVRRVLADPEQCEAENLALGRSLADAVARCDRVPRLVAASTSEVYEESRAPLSESHALRPLRASGRWRYAAAKRACEDLFDAALAGTRPAARPLHLRFFNVVGPGQDGTTGMVLPRFVEAARRGEPLEIFGSGTSVRTFAHVDAVAADVAALVLPELAAPRGARAEVRAAAGPINVGGSARASVLELADLVVRVAAEPTGRTSPLVRVDPRLAVGANFAEVSHRVPDLSRLRDLGLGAGSWTLEAIVRDAVDRHAAPRAAAAASLCASPAS